LSSGEWRKRETVGATAVREVFGELEDLGEPSAEGRGIGEGASPPDGDFGARSSCIQDPLQGR